MKSEQTSALRAQVSILLRCTNPPLAADSHLAYNVLQKTSSTRKVFSFCQSFQSGTDLQNRAQMAAEKWLRCKPSIEGSGTFPSLTSSFESSLFFFLYSFLEMHLKCTKISESENYSGEN